jgi:hypothetical protein
MPTPQPEDDQENPGTKLQFHETLPDETRPDSVRLCQSEGEPSQAETGASQNVDASAGMPNPAAQPSIAIAETGAASTQPVEQSDTSIKDELASVSGKTIAESYKEELLIHSLQTLIPDLIKNGRDKEAEIGSRLLVDLTEHRITASEAKEIFQLIEARHKDEALQLYANLHRGVKNRKALVAASIAMIMFATFSAMSMISISLHHHGPHNRSARFPTQAEWRFLPISMESRLRSISGSTATTFTITNKLDKPVSLNWLNYQGERVLYANLEPGQSAGEQTYLTHPWVVVDEGKAIMLFVPGTNLNQQIEVQ